MAENRKLAAILVADIVGYSRLVGADEEGTLKRLRGLRSELFDPTVAAHNGRLVKRTGDGAVVEFKSVVEAVRCALEVAKGLGERNEGLPADQRIEVRTGVHLGDVVEEADGDLMGDGVNIAARLEGVCTPGSVCLSEDAYRQVRDKLPDATFVDLGDQQLKNIARPIRAYALGAKSQAFSGPLQTDPAALRPVLDPRRTQRPLAKAVTGLIDILRNLAGTHTEGIGARSTAATRSELSDAAVKRRDRNLRRTIILAAILAIAAIRACREPQRQAAPPPAQGRASTRMEEPALKNRCPPYPAPSSRCA
jgi:class 3 adenylate cyclase